MTVPKCWIGVDPGSKSGAMTVISEAYAEPKCYDFSEDLVDVIISYKILQDIQAVTIELVHAFHKQGVVSTWTFAENFGLWKGWFSALGYTPRFVTPQVWMKAYGVPKGMGLTPRKKWIHAKALELYPDAPVFTPGKRKGSMLKNYGKSDSLLICDWGKSNRFTTTPENTL